ncbi:UDP-GalNAc:beta-1,3-N-acetylgalactosaminyltransferase 1-like [Gigantopelta aegis]|uniref:UDP-GalNAc:beta-1, 3-N-acetylgalactosaminyltransferase 1-like n=1 Tax=Gigantopelta aegis TaxID=1735272 RepID=UPI001B888B69|nr:UDP-GalNAc:beta-1,3-N-acetylgalactosaminyltransferase 1-like [Gigantopelta aegis]
MNTSTVNILRTTQSSHSKPSVNVNERKTSHSNPSVNVTARKRSNSNAGVILTELPVPEAFSESGFYGDRRILKYRWFFKPNKTRHFQLNHRFLKGSAKACTHKERHQLVVLVMTMHHMESQRQAIRNTWGSVSTLGTWPGSTEKFSIKLLFVLGVSKNESLNIAVSKEAEERGDLIIAAFDESYYNLTRKVLMGFKWISEFCPTAKYVMKVDEDTYLNIPKNVHRLRKFPDSTAPPAIIANFEYMRDKELILTKVLLLGKSKITIRTEH